MGAASHTRTSRTIGSGPRQGERIPVSTDTHVTGILVHASGALSTIFMSFDAVGSVAANIEVHGESGSLVVPDPNRFDGDVRLRTLGTKEWTTLPVSAGYVQSSRGFGLEDMANTATGQEPRAGGKLAFHVLEVMESLLASAREGRVVAVESRCERPRAVPLS
jgi:predicted dehydrogenase